MTSAPVTDSPTWDLWYETMNRDKQKLGPFAGGAGNKVLSSVLFCLNTHSTVHSVTNLSHPSSLSIAMEAISSNSTLLSNPDTYFEIYNELSKYNVHLNIFERLWAVRLLHASV
jgi:hypothetical protein